MLRFYYKLCLYSSSFALSMSVVSLTQKNLASTNPESFYVRVIQNPFKPGVNASLRERKKRSYSGILIVDKLPLQRTLVAIEAQPKTFNYG